MIKFAFSPQGAAPDAAAEAQRDLHIAPVPRISIQAFCESMETATTLQAAAEDRRMQKAHVKVQMGGGVAAVEAYRSAPTPNVIVLEMDASRDEILNRLDELAECCDAGTKVVVIGRVNDIILYREMVRRGVSDYMMAPLGVVDVIRSVSGLYSQPDAAPLGRTLAVVGAKGGVGASTIAHNIGWAVARDLELDTVVADLDLAFGTAGLDFNQDPPQGMSEAVFAPERLDHALVDRLLSKCTEHLSLLAAPAMLDKFYDFGPEAFDPVIDVLRGSVPTIVLDVPHTWNAWTRRTLVGADEILIVVAPDLANLRNAKNLIDSLKGGRPNDRKPHYIINMMGVPKRPELKPSDFAKALDAEPLAVIPFEPQLFGTAANNGQMLAEVSAQHKTTDMMRHIAEVLTGRGQVRHVKKTLLSPLLEKLQRKS